MTYLGVSVIVGVTVFTYACNASLERIKKEQLTKVAAFDLRLALRRIRVIASAKCARLLHETRDKHYDFACQVLADKRRMTVNQLPPRDRLFAADAADLALTDDLVKGRNRVHLLTDLAQQDLVDAKDALENPDDHPNAKHLMMASTTKGNPFLTKLKHAWGDEHDHDNCEDHDGFAISGAETESEKQPSAEDAFLKALTAKDEVARDDELVYWKKAKTGMALSTLKALLTELSHEHDQDLKAIYKDAAKHHKHLTKEAPSPKTPKTPTTPSSPKHGAKKEEEEEVHHHELQLMPPWVVTAWKDLWRCCRTGPQMKWPSLKILPLPDKTGSTSDETVAAAQKALDFVLDLVADVGVNEMDGSLDGLKERLQTLLEAREPSKGPLPELEEIKDKIVAVARWGLLRDALQLTIQRKWRLTAPTKEATLNYRQHLLPRAFCHYSSLAMNEKKARGVHVDNWRQFLQDANVLEETTTKKDDDDASETSETSDVEEAPKKKKERRIGRAKAEAIFATLPKTGVDQSGKAIMSYGSFRQAMRQTAVLLYSHLPETDALKLLGQVHVFPNVRLATARETYDAGLLHNKRPPQPRMVDFLAADASSHFGTKLWTKSTIKVLEKAKFGGSQNFEEKVRIRVAKQAGSNFGRIVEDAERRIAKANAAFRQILSPLPTPRSDDDDMEDSDDDEDDDDDTPELTELLLNGEGIDPNSKEARKLRDLQDEASREQADLPTSCIARFRAMFSLSLETKELGDAQMELELLKAGADALKEPSEDKDDDDDDKETKWEDIAEVIVSSLRESADNAASQDVSEQRQDLQIAMNVDNFFALFELVTEFVSFASLGFKGAAGFGWGLARECDFNVDGCNSAAASSKTSKTKSTLSFVAAAPLATLKYDTMGQFWIVCAVCFVTPLYLLEAVNAAREQRIGTNADGSPLKMFSLGWWYHQSTKMLQATMPPIMTTLVSVLVCDACDPSEKLSRMSTPCTSLAHVIQLVAALTATLAYYPAISFIQPQLQFKSKALDFKFEPSYLVFLSQGKLVLAGAVNFFSQERYARSCVTGNTKALVMRGTVQLLVFAALTATALAAYTWRTRPCIVRDFSTVRACTLASAASILWVSAAAFVARHHFVSKDIARKGGLLLVFLLLFVFGRTAWTILRRLFFRDSSSSATSRTTNRIHPEEGLPVASSSSSSSSSSKNRKETN